MSEATHRARGAVIALTFSLVFSPTSFASQTPQGEALGVVNTTGEVYLSNTPVPGQATIYAGETLRTAADGAAQVAISGSGTFTLASQSQMSFPALPTYLAVVEQGTVGLRSLEGAKNLRLRVRNFVVIEDPAHEAAAQVEFGADGNVRVSCLTGSVGVTQFEGGLAALFLNPGQVAIITANGILLRGGPQAQATSEASTSPAPAGKKKSRTPLYLLLGLAGGGAAAGAAAALSSHSANRPTITPTVP